MKAFEEWFNETGGHYGEFEHENECETAWRAALEWVRSTAKELDEQGAPISMHDVIEQELEDE